MKKLVLLIGIPGSGKTTLAKTLLEKGFERICADDIREELYGNAIEQGNAKEVFGIFFARLEDLFVAEKNIVIDNTNVRRTHRQQIIERAKKFNYNDIQLWLLDVPLELCLQRNKARVRKVEEEIITSLFNDLNRFSKPKPTEGQIIIVKEDKAGGWQFLQFEEGL